MIAPHADSIFGLGSPTVADAHAAADQHDRDLAGYVLPLTRSQLWELEQRAELRDQRRQTAVYRAFTCSALDVAASSRPREREAT
jgi:Zn-dependent oligopeptidase